MVINIIPILDRKLKTLYLKYKDAHIDNGGCGFIANALHQILSDMGYQPRIVVLTNYIWYWPNQDSITAVQDMVNSNSTLIQTNNDINDRGIVLTHVMLNLNGHYIDLSGCYKRIEETSTWKTCKETLELTPEILKRITSTQVGWNDMFDINRLPEIKSDIERELDDIRYQIDHTLLSA